jgi:predicted nucleic acid-binding protein
VHAELRRLAVTPSAAEAITRARLNAASYPDLAMDDIVAAVHADRPWELRTNLSSYDAGYVAPAERLRSPLITGDARLAAAPGTRCPIELIR